MGMIDNHGRIATLYRNDSKLGENRKFAFCVKHCLSMNPGELKKAWQEVNKIRKAKAVPKKSNVDKATPVVESQTAIAQAMENKAS
jgi:hypothetical protein